MTDKECKAYIAKFMIACAVLIFLYGTIYSIIYTDSSLISIVIIQIITSIFGGVPLGYFIASLALLKMILFADNPSDLPVYTGIPLGNMFENIVDVLYTGVLGLKTFKVNGDFCEISVNVFLDNLYDNGNRIFQRRDKYRVWVRKNIAQIAELNTIWQQTTGSLQKLSECGSIDRHLSFPDSSA